MKRPSAIFKVVVRDTRRDPQRINVLESLEELAAFQAMWSAKEAIDLFDNPPKDYKLEIHRGSRGKPTHSVWLYESSGITRLLTKQHTLFFEVLDPEAFNELCGIA